MKKNKSLIAFILFIFISLTILLFNSDVRYRLLWLLPIGFAIVYLLFLTNAPREKKKEFGYVFIRIIMIFRYVLTPLVIVLGQDYKGLGPEPSGASMSRAILLMIYELFIVSMIVWIMMRRRSYKNTKSTFKIERNNFLNYFTIILFVFVLIINHKLIIPINFSESFKQMRIINYKFNNDGFMMILSNILRILFSIMGLKFIHSLKIKQKLKVHLSLFFMLFVILMYLSRSRWDTVSILIIYFILLSTIYEKHKKIILSYIITFGGALLITTTYLKFTVVQHQSFLDLIIGSVKNFINIISNQFQVYFSGPRNIALAIEMKDGVNPNFYWLINDFFGSLPGLSKYFNQEIRLNKVFNIHIYNTDMISQIIPMAGIGINTVGFLFTPLILSFFIYLVSILNDKYYSTDSIELKYILLYMIVFTTFAFGMNIQILTNKYYASFIPSYFIILFLTNNAKIRLE